MAGCVGVSQAVSTPVAYQSAWIRRCPVCVAVSMHVRTERAAEGGKVSASAGSRRVGRP